MKVLAPWQTAWPAGAALLVLLAALLAARRHLVLPRRDRLAAAALVALALAVRLAWVPAWSAHLYDGHEAEYWDLFRGLRAPTRGGTVLYPAVQWFWWGLGRVLPADPRLPVLLAAPRNPAQAWVAATAMALVVATRLDAALLGLPVLGVALLGLRRQGAAAWARAWLPAGAVALVLAGLAAWPLVWPGEVPGAGERALSFAINAGFLAPFAPFDRPAGLALVGLGAALAFRRWPAATLALVPPVALDHLVLATFDDYGERHALVALPGIAWALAAGGASLAARRRWPAALWSAAILAVLGRGLVEMRARYYAPEERFAAVLAAPPYAALPRLPLDAARDGCGWVAEDPRVARDPPVSHFNLLDPDEERRLRGRDGCLRWCLDVQDYRWSSRSVRDRALRLAHLFAVRPAAVVEEPASGYACLVVELGPRRVGPGKGSDERVDDRHPPLP